jgi:hypothetical protein
MIDETRLEDECDLYSSMACISSVCFLLFGWMNWIPTRVSKLGSGTQHTEYEGMAGFHDRLGGVESADWDDGWQDVMSRVMNDDQKYH